MHGGKILDQVEIILRDERTQDTKSIFIDVYDHSLSRKWLDALDHLLANGYHLEKNYCFFGFIESDRDAQYILDQINHSISEINRADIGYHIYDEFTLANTIKPGTPTHNSYAGHLEHDKFNQLHRYFEDLQGVSGQMSPFYQKADEPTRWHIRQLNLLCHEYESLVLSMHKAAHAPEWRRPSQLMCWLNAPRFNLAAEDFELFGVETINRPLGGVFIGVNKAIGKHHWEVFNDEGRDSRIDELTTTSMRPQTEAAGDFDIEWANNPGDFPWQKIRLQQFREWLTANGFDPEDKSLTIGHPQCGQVDLDRSFGTKDYRVIWQGLSRYLDVYSIKTSRSQATFDYSWRDADYMQRQIMALRSGVIK